MLEQYIRQTIEAHQAEVINIAWQGGEPSLMGLDFYRRALALAEKHRRPGPTFLHTMQTDGVLLDDEWATFFKEDKLPDRHKPGWAARLTQLLSTGQGRKAYFR